MSGNGKARKVSLCNHRPPKSRNSEIPSDATRGLPIGPASAKFRICHHRIPPHFSPVQVVQASSGRDCHTVTRYTVTGSGPSVWLSCLDCLCLEIDRNRELASRLFEFCRLMRCGRQTVTDRQLHISSSPRQVVVWSNSRSQQGGRGRPFLPGPHGLCCTTLCMPISILAMCACLNLEGKCGSWPLEFEWPPANGSRSI
jgi:hypothetical protein